MRPRRPALLAAAALALGGCGSRSPGELPPAAEPARSPPLNARPAGRVVPIGPYPEGVVADPRSGLVAVGTRRPAQLVLVTGRTGRVLRRVPLRDGPRHLGLAGPAGPVVVPTERAARVLRVALPSGRIVNDARVGASAHDATSVGGSDFVGNEGADSVSEVAPGRPAQTFAVARQPGGVVAFDGGRRLAVISVRERVLEVFDTATHRRLGRVPVGLGITHVVPLDADRLVVADTAGDALLVVRVRPKLEVQRRVDLPGSPYGLAFDRVHRRVWVTLTAVNRLVELSTGPKPGATRVLPTVRQPDTVAVDPATGRVFVTGRAAGVLELIDP